MNYTPPAPQAAPRKYTRPRRPFSVIGIVIGLIVGLAGALYFAWEVSPVQEFDTELWQLREDDKAQYMVAIALAFAQDGDVNAAVARLLELRLPGDPIQAMADTACRLATSGYVNSSSGLQAVRSMIRFYTLQGRSGCADALLSGAGASTPVIEVELPTPTPSLTPPPTKTPEPLAGLASPTPVQIIVPTSPPRSDFELVNVTTLCSTALRGVIQVYVYEANGSTGVPGQAIRARWSGGESIFFTGLKPEMGDAYADFQMEEGQNYIIDMPNRSDPIREPLAPVPCNTTDTGARSITSYRVVFRAIG